jgi:predicted CoA-binding protein
MTSKAQIDEFLSQKTLAFVGVSRSPRQFANAAFRELQKAGYRLLPVHPEMDTFEGIPCHRRLVDLPEPVGGLVAMVAPDRAEAVVHEAAAAHIPRIWFQQQASSEAAVRACASLGIAAVHDQCIMMFMPGNAFVHRFHRGILGLFGRLPK